VPIPMKRHLGLRDCFSSLVLYALPVCLVVLLCCTSSRAQSAAEYSGASSVSATTTASQPKPNGWSATSTAQDPNKSQHLAASAGPAPEIVNRQALEQHAGKDACKLLLRSVPSAAQVFVDGAFVGNSPMLLVLSPGKYQIEMRGRRLEFAERVVDLLPRETREVALPLTTRYPTRVTTH
jgi:PEGA domain